MQDRIVVNNVLAKCEALKRTGLWLPEPKLRPRAWLANFDEPDQVVAAKLLDRFTFYSEPLTNQLLISAYDSLADGLPKGPSAPSRNDLLAAAAKASLTPVLGENPNPTDSGNLFCRRARQLLDFPQSSILDMDRALDAAYAGGPIMFIDDFVGSGDQFLSTWRKEDPYKRSFSDAASKGLFVAIYVTLVATKQGIGKIQSEARGVAISAAHVLDEKYTIYSIETALQHQVHAFLAKYAPRLQPKEPYMAARPEYVRLGYKRKGLLLGFEHSIPDLTLPIFWSRGKNPTWEPLFERT